jgi:hypothetical protein
MKKFHQDLVSLLNDWRDNLEPINEDDFKKYEFAKNKFKTFYLKKTGEFLKISQRVETISFNKIAHALSKHYEVDNDLMNEYLEWCFDNYEVFLRKYKVFNLNCVASFASEWERGMLSFEENIKFSMKDLNSISVKNSSIFELFEIYGIPFVATKLFKEINGSKKNLENKIIEKLNTLTNNAEDLSRLRNMLRNTVENGPYSSEILLKDYKEKFNDLFQYFSGEAWTK